VAQVAPGVGAQAQVLGNAQLHEGAPALGDVTHAQAHDVLGGPALDARAPERDLAGGLHHAAHGAQGRGLAGAVGAEDRGDPALGHLEAQPAQDSRVTVASLEIAHVQESGHQPMVASASVAPR
jgi:hypothetical protein